MIQTSVWQTLQYSLFYFLVVTRTNASPAFFFFCFGFCFCHAQKAIDHAFKLVSKRLDDLCNFVEDDTLFGDDTHLIYRHFATLYFIVICDKAESELGILDLIQVGGLLKTRTC